MSARKGDEPNATVEISSTEVTPVHRPSRRTSFCSVHNCGEDVASAALSSEVDERRSIACCRRHRFQGWGEFGFGEVVTPAGPERSGPAALGLELWGPEGGRPNISRFFFPLPPPCSLFFSLSGSLLVEFWWRLKRRDPLMRTFGVLALQTPPKFHDKTPREREKERTWRWEREKSAKFWAVRRRGVRWRK